MDAPTSDLQRSIFLGKIRRARLTPPADKLAEAAELFDATVALMRDAIMTANPENSPEEVQAEVVRRLRIARRLDEAGIFKAAGTIDDQP